jgi:iron complex transport system substrate-binding protein
MEKNKIRLILILSLLISIFGVIGLYLHGTETYHGNESQITDMIGRNVDMPSEVNRVSSLSYSVSVLIYMLAPDKMIGWDTNRTEAQNRYLPQRYKILPTLGGGKKDANYESYISLKPDLVFVGHGNNKEDVDRIQEKLGNIALVDVEGDNNLSNIKSSIKFVGMILGEQDKSDKLINFYEKVIYQVNTTASPIPVNEKKRVYYARDPTGLQTNPSGASHTQLIEICGGTNVAQVPITKGTIGVSIEQVLKWNPDIIIASDPSFYSKIYSDPQWQNVKAVQNTEVYLVPSSPFNWFESPPGANVILGVAWTAKVLYPDKFKDLDIKNLTVEFYSDFYHYNLTDEEVSNILSSSGLKDF